MSGEDATGPVVIKKYANRRLYNTETSSYVTLEDLADLVRSGRDFVVRDAKTGEDLTRQVLAQIIFEQENKGATLLPEDFLRQLIRFYGDSLGQMLPRYLEAAMQAFVRQQDEMRRLMGSAMDPTGMWQAMGRMAEEGMRNFQQAMLAFWGQTPAGPSVRKEPPASPGKAEDADEEGRLSVLERQLAAIERELQALKKGRSGPSRN